PFFTHSPYCLIPDSSTLCDYLARFLNIFLNNRTRLLYNHILSINLFTSFTAVSSLPSSKASIDCLKQVFAFPISDLATNISPSPRKEHPKLIGSPDLLEYSRDFFIISSAFSKQFFFNRIYPCS